MTPITHGNSSSYLHPDIQKQSKEIDNNVTNMFVSRHNNPDLASNISTLSETRISQPPPSDSQIFVFDLDEFLNQQHDGINKILTEEKKYDEADDVLNTEYDEINILLHHPASLEASRIKNKGTIAIASNSENDTTEFIADARTAEILNRNPLRMPSFRIGNRVIKNSKWIGVFTAQESLFIQVTIRQVLAQIEFMKQQATERKKQEQQRAEERFENDTRQQIENNEIQVQTHHKKTVENSKELNNRTLKLDPLAKGAMLDERENLRVERSEEKKVLNEQLSETLDENKGIITRSINDRRQNEEAVKTDDLPNKTGRNHQE